MSYNNNSSNFGSWKSVKEQDRDREQQARDRRAEASSAYLADEAND